MHQRMTFLRITMRSKQECCDLYHCPHHLSPQLWLPSGWPSGCQISLMNMFPMSMRTVSKCADLSIFRENLLAVQIWSIAVLTQATKTTRRGALRLLGPRRQPLCMGIASCGTVSCKAEFLLCRYAGQNAASALQVAELVVEALSYGVRLTP